MLSENDFEAVLATFWCYEYGANASETIQRIATDQKDYQKCSSCVIVCWISKMHQSVTVKKAPEVAQKKEQWLGNGGSEITTWMEYSIKTECTKSKATFSR